MEAVILDDLFSATEGYDTAFKVVLSATEAESIAAFLQEKGIDCMVERPRIRFNVITQSDGSTGVYRIMLKSENDILLAQNALSEISAADIAALPKDYYLFGFTTEKLSQIITTEKDEWGEFDYALAQHLLTQRGENIADIKAAAASFTPYKPENMRTALRIFLVALCFAGNPIPLISAYKYYTATVVNSNGKLVHQYNESTRAFVQWLPLFFVFGCFIIYRAFFR
jgi:hypothetical protein